MPSAKFRVQWYKAPTLPCRVHGQLQVERDNDGYTIVGVLGCSKDDWLLLAPVLMRAGVELEQILPPAPGPILAEVVDK